MNRRHFLVGTLATPFALRAASPKFDLVIKGGRVIDPSRKFDGLADVGITQGRITAVRSGIATTGAEVFDAKGKLVVPGLIDIHTHATRIADGPSLCLADGVTGIIDAGSQGATAGSDPDTISKRSIRPLSQDGSASSGACR